MKSVTLLLSAGLVSAINLAAPVVQSGTLDPNLIANSSNIDVGENGSSNENIASLLNGINTGGVNGLDLSNLGSNLNLGNLDFGGLNLGSIDLSNQNDVANAILEMMQLLCVGNNLDLNGLLNLGSNGDLELFLEMAQLLQLEQLGFINVGGIQSLINSGLVFGNFGNVNNVGFNSFNLGGFSSSIVAGPQGSVSNSPTNARIQAFSSAKWPRRGRR
jgi:hypothetical protein